MEIDKSIDEMLQMGSSFETLVNSKLMAIALLLNEILQELKKNNMSKIKDEMIDEKEFKEGEAESTLYVKTDLYKDRDSTVVLEFPKVERTDAENEELFPDHNLSPNPLD